MNWPTRFWLTLLFGVTAAVVLTYTGLFFAFELTGALR